MQTVWVVTDNPAWYRLTRFFGKLFLINFALGVATGIVQEFQFGMNWSEYSRFVGDIFGAPLAMEGLVAFFFESTFIGLWIFGWNRLPKKVHLACIWIVALGVNASAFFIISANSFMQHPVGAHYSPETGRAELTSIADLFTNNTGLAAFAHVITGALLTAGTFVAGVSAWWMVRARGEDDAAALYRPATVLGCVVSLLATATLLFTGDIQGKLMFVQQPMKMASAESLCHNGEDAGNLFGALEALRIPIEYLAGLFSAGDTAVVEGVLRRLAAMRSYMRDINLGRETKPHIPQSVGMTEKQVYQMYRLLAIAKYEERYVIPSAYATEGGSLEEPGCSLSFDSGPGMYESGPFGEASGGPVPVAVETFHALRQRQRTEGMAANAQRPSWVNLLNWDGRGVPTGMFPDGGDSR